MEINNYITVAISITAIVISIIAYIQNLKSQNRQLRIEKIEEMVEITHMLNANYQYFEDTQFFKTQLLLDPTKTNEKDNYLTQVKALNRISDEIDIRNKLSRLYVLNSSYLPKSELKNKVGVLIGVFTSIAESTLFKPTEKTNLPFNEFPKKWGFLEFTEEIQNELIAEMRLGYKNNIGKKNNSIEIFKERYKLK